MAADPVRAKIQTQAIWFCPRRDCRTAVFLDLHECPACKTPGIRCSATIGLVERTPEPTRETRYIPEEPFR